MIAKERIPACLKWPGGKHYLAPKILAEAAKVKHNQYVETHFGRGEVLFRKQFDGIAEIANDLDERLMSFWTVMADRAMFDELHRRLDLATPFSQKHYEIASETLQQFTKEVDLVNMAWAMFVVVRQSFAGDQKSFAPRTKNRTRRGMQEQVSAWLTAIEGLTLVHARLKRVLMMNTDGAKLVSAQDTKSTLFYADPCYITTKQLAEMGEATAVQLAAARTTEQIYRHEMTLQDHRNLLDALSGISGSFVLSGYDNPLYEDYRKQNKWRRVDVVIDNKMAKAKDKPGRVESLWANF